jgi:hypothetical protein
LLRVAAWITGGPFTSGTVAAFTDDQLSERETVQLF